MKLPAGPISIELHDFSASASQVAEAAAALTLRGLGRHQRPGAGGIPEVLMIRPLLTMVRHR